MKIQHERGAIDMLNPFEAAVTIGCAYEVVALVVDRPPVIPPISHLCWRWQVLGPVIVTSLTVHLLFGKNKSAFVAPAPRVTGPSYE